jgi:hypothetical protein
MNSHAVGQIYNSPRIRSQASRGYYEGSIRIAAVMLLMVLGSIAL